jgi:tRNA threonylcarbamoyladenosine biosynthesis protein TsaB
MQPIETPSLAIETSGRCGSVALVVGDGVLAEELFPHGLKHAAELLPMIDRLLRSRGYEPGNVANLYVSEGPGSFTGLRIAVTLAKTLALATGVKLVAVPTLKALAMNAPPQARHVIVVLDAKRDQIFTARFEQLDSSPDHSPDEFHDATWIEREPAHLDSLAAMIDRSPRPVHLLGEGLPFHEKFLPADRHQIIITPESAWRARASTVAKIGIAMAAIGQFTDPDRFVPRYIRKPEAEEKWEQSQSQQ